MTTMTETKPPITHVLLIVDESGSMQPLANDVRGGLNTYLDDLQADKAHRYRITVTLFNTLLRHHAVAGKPKKVARFDKTNYRPSGSTALYDAIGFCVRDFEEVVPELGDGERVLLVVQTDGQENHSTTYTAPEIQKLIADSEATGRWTCVYLGAGPDAWGGGQLLGFAAANTVHTDKSSGATQSTYSGLTRATVAYADGADAGQTVTALREELGGNALPVDAQP